MTTVPGRLRRLPWAPIGVATGGVTVIFVATLLLYPLTQPAPRPPAGAAAERTAEMAAPAGPSSAPPGSASASASASPAPSPSPSRSATPTRPARPGGRPSAANTGAIPGVALTVVNGDQTFGTDGKIVEDVDIHGYVRITGKRVTIRNAIVRGGAARCGAVVQIEAGASAVLEDVEVAPAAAGPCLDGIWATAATLTRVNVHGGVNGVKATGPDVLLQDSWVHDGAFFARGAPGGGGTETDAVESVGERRITLRRNVLVVGAHGNAAYQVRQTGGGTSTELRVEGNWLDGGACTLNFAHQGGPPMTGIAVVNNRFGHNTTFACPILVSTQTTLTQNTGNVFDDTGAPIPAPNRHD
ncbi:hypothetical protein [Dactylosporangium sp. CA-092794]|uniref:hypothetical protein n=1 Tax=Dactylosporangium sp. CA-092794 TaxID=3239929 RepID=UPI003D8CDAB7